MAWYQDDAASTELGDHPRFTVPEPALRRAIRDARAAHLQVLLFPIVRLSRPRAPDEWRGTLHPADRRKWFAAYVRKLIALAQLANQEHAEALSIGSELSTLDGAADHDAWAMLVSEVHAVYRGRLVYSGNWDHFREVGIYDLVDQIGLCGYFALADRAEAAAHAVPVDDLVRTWRDLRVELERFAELHGRPILFTEVGYLSQRGAAAWPWEEGARQPVDLDEQRRCYAAFCRIWRDAAPAHFAGVYFWNWYGWGGSASRGYTPRGKPAAEEIRGFFTR